MRHAQVPGKGIPKAPVAQGRASAQVRVYRGTRGWWAMISVLVAGIIAGAGVGFLTGVRVQKRAQRIERELEDAEKAKTALIGYVVVDGHELPPSGVAWKIDHCTFTGDPKQEIPCITFGPVTVRPDELIFVGQANPLSVTPATKAYANAAWMAYRNQAVRAVVDGKST